MVYQWQTAFYEKRYSTPHRRERLTLSSSSKLSAVTVSGRKTWKNWQMPMKKALDLEGPVWIDCNIAYEDKVLPMIPNGKTIDDMLFE